MMSAEEIERILSGLVLYPKKEAGRTARIAGGPVVSLYWGREGVELLVAFQGGRDQRMKAVTFSTGRSLWIRDRTHRLSKAFAAEVAASIAEVMDDPRFSSRRTATSPCPECGHGGPHDDNGEKPSSIHLSFCCSKCGGHFDAVEI